MPRKIPVVPLVFGIINLIFGLLNLVSCLGCSLVTAAFYAVLRQAYDSAPREDQGEMDALWAAFSDNVPLLVPVSIAFMVLSIGLALVQTLSGLGLVMIRQWGRWLCVLWGVVQILVTAASLFYLIAILAPGVQRAAKDFEGVAERIDERDRKLGRPVPPRQKMDQMGTGNHVMDNIALVALALVTILYAGLVIVFMVLPQTGQAIARYRAPVEETAPPPQDDNDEYERQRRWAEPVDGAGPPYY